MSSPSLSRLTEAPIDEIMQMIYRPSIARMDDAAFAVMCALNQAHLVMAAECDMPDAATVKTLAQAVAE